MRLGDVRPVEPGQPVRRHPDRAAAGGVRSLARRHQRQVLGLGQNHGARHFRAGGSAVVHFSLVRPRLFFSDNLQWGYNLHV